MILQGTVDHEGLFIDITPAGQAVVKLLLSIIIIIIIIIIIREYGSTLYIGIAMVFCVTFGPM